MDRCKSRITAQPTTFTVAVCTRCRRDRDKGTGVLLDTGGSRMGYLLLRNKQPVLQEKADKAPGTRCLLVSVAQAWERLTQPALLSSQESPSSCGLYVCVVMSELEQAGSSTHKPTQVVAGSPVGCVAEASLTSLLVDAGSGRGSSPELPIGQLSVAAGVPQGRVVWGEGEGRRGRDRGRECAPPARSQCVSPNLGRELPPLCHVLCISSL